MDITSPITLWKDYDVSALPLNEYELSQKTENGATVRELYFDGYTTVDGRTRAFIKITENPSSKGVILYLPDSAGRKKDAVASLNSLGYTVAELDYLGTSQTEAHFTLYPRSLTECNKRGERKFTLVDSENVNYWYVWVCIARRATKLLAGMYPDKKLFAVGMGLGGTTVYKLSSFDDGLTACATLLNIIPDVEGAGNAIINYHAAHDCSAYATLGKLPLFMAISSNDEDGSLDEMSELAENTVSLKRFRIVKRAFADGINAAYKDVDSFFTACADSLPQFTMPEVAASNSEGNLYFDIEIPDSDLCDEAPKTELLVSFCIEDAPFRNWMSIPVISLGKDKFIAHVNVCSDTKPIHAFANVTYENGEIQTSAVLGVIPKTLGIKAKPGVSHRKIYDGSMGKDGWIARNGGAVTPVKGPFDIDGVTSETNSLITFKPGDPLFKVSPDILLQIMLCGAPQKVTITVRDRQNSYSCTADITTAEEWQKFSYSHMNFKGAAGMLTDWSQIAMLELSSDKNFIIGSVLWV